MALLSVSVSRSLARMQSSFGLGEGKDRMHFQGHSLGYWQASKHALPWPSPQGCMVANFTNCEQSKEGKPPG